MPAIPRGVVENSFIAANCRNIDGCDGNKRVVLGGQDGRRKAYGCHDIFGAGLPIVIGRALESTIPSRYHVVEFADGADPSQALKLVPRITVWKQRGFPAHAGFQFAHEMTLVNE